MLASQMRGLADALLIPVNTLARLPPGTTQAFVDGTVTGAVKSANVPKKKRVSAYTREYKRAFKRVSKQYRKKDGSWKKDGFKRAVRASHKAVKRK